MGESRHQEQVYRMENLPMVRGHNMTYGAIARALGC
jgi:hypothetical protein